MSGRRKDTPIRFRAFRGDATVGSVERTLLEKFGLKVTLRNPDGRDSRSDQLIRTYRKNHTPKSK